MRLMARDGYILAVATGFLYLMAYFNVLAKANFYDIPLEMMSFDFFQLTRAAIGIFASLLGMALSLLAIFWLLTVRSKKSVFLYFVSMVFLVPLLFFFILRDKNETVAYSVAIFFLAMFAILFFLVKNLRKIGAMPALINFGYKYFFSLVRVRAILFGFMFFMLILSSYMSSYASAKWNSNYDIFTKEGYYALISTSTDYVIVKKIINKELSDEFYIFKMEDLRDVGVRNRDIRELPRNNSMQSIELPAGFL